MSNTDTEQSPMMLVIGFAVGSILFALLGANFWVAVLGGLVGVVVAYFVRRR